MPQKTLEREVLNIWKDFFTSIAPVSSWSCKAAKRDFLDVKRININSKDYMKTTRINIKSKSYIKIIESNDNLIRNRLGEALVSDSPYIREYARLIIEEEK